MLWLRFDKSPAELPLRVASHRRAVATTTSLAVLIGRRQAEVQQETDFAVQFGILDALEILIPASIGSQWDVDGGARRIDLGASENGDRLYRLEWNAAPASPSRLQFRYRIGVEEAFATDAAGIVKIPWIKVLHSTSTTPVHAVIDAEPGVTATASGAAWTQTNTTAVGLPVDDSRLKLTSRLNVAEPDALTFRVSARRPADLPRALASRLWLRSRQDSTGDLLTRAVFRMEACGPELAVALPTGATLLAVWVGGVVIREVEPLSESGAFRINLPAATHAGPLVVELNYRLAATLRGVRGPRRGCLARPWCNRRFGKCATPWNRAVVGVPAGWTDENEWHWDHYFFKRRPVLSMPVLVDWVADPNPPADPIGDDQSYLFGHTAGAADLPITLASRHCWWRSVRDSSCWSARG